MESPTVGTAGLAWRPLDAADLPAWQRLEAAVERADGLAERFTVDDLRDELLAGSWKDPARDSLVGVDTDGVARAFALVEVRPGDVRSRRAFCWGGVDPAWRGRGAGRALLAWQLGRARELVAGRGDVPARAVVHADEGAADRERLLGRAGLTRRRWYVVMRRPLTVAGAAAVPDAVLPAGLRLVPFAAGLDEAVRRAHNEAFADHWGSEPRSREDWRTWTTGHRDFRADWSHVLLDGDEVAGYALSAAYPQDWAGQGWTEGWLSLLGVRPAWRRRGLARVLLVAAMRSYAAAGLQYAGLDVDTDNRAGALGLYEGVGFAAVRRTVMWTLDLRRPGGGR